MNRFKQPYLPHLLSECNYSIENDDWRSTQEILLTRFGQIQYSDIFRTINQDCELNEKLFLSIESFY